MFGNIEQKTPVLVMGGVHPVSKLKLDCLPKKILEEFNKFAAINYEEQATLIHYDQRRIKSDEEVQIINSAFLISKSVIEELISFKQFVNKSEVQVAGHIESILTGLGNLKTTETIKVLFGSRAGIRNAHNNSLSILKDQSSIYIEIPCLLKGYNGIFGTTLYNNNFVDELGILKDLKNLSNSLLESFDEKTSIIKIKDNYSKLIIQLLLKYNILKEYNPETDLINIVTRLDDFIFGCGLDCKEIYTNNNSEKLLKKNEVYFLQFGFYFNDLLDYVTKNIDLQKNINITNLEQITSKYMTVKYSITHIVK